MATGIIDIILAANPSGLIDGMTKAEKATQNAEVSMKNSMKKVDGVLGSTILYANELGNVADRAANILRTNLGKGAEEAAGGMLDLLDGVGQTSDAVVSGIGMFVQFRSVATTAVTKVAGLFPVMGSSITAVLGPIGLVIAALGAIYIVVQNNFDAISKILFKATNWFIELYNSTTIVRVGVEQIRFTFGILWDFVKNIFLNIIDSLGAVGQVMNSIVKGEFTKIPDIITGTYEIVKSRSLTFYNQVADDANAALSRIRGDVKLNPISQSEWDKQADKVRGFLRISKPVDIEPSDAEVAAVVKNTQKKLDNEVRPVIEIALLAPKELKPVTDQVTATIKKLEGSLRDVDAKYSLVGDKTSAMREKSSLMLKTLQELGSGGFDINNAQIQGLVNQYDTLLKAIEAAKTTAKEADDTFKVTGSKGPSSKGSDKPQTLSEKIFNPADAGSIALGLEIPNIKETEDAISKLNLELEKQRSILTDPAASAQAKKNAEDQIAATNLLIKSEKDKGNVALSVTKQIYNAVRERIKAYIAEGIAGLIAKEIGTKGIIGLATAAAGSALAVGLFEKLIPKLAVGTDEVLTSGLAIIHAGEKILPATVEPGGYTENGSDGGFFNFVGRIIGPDLVLASQYAGEEIYRTRP